MKFTHSKQIGEPGRAFLAQVFGPDGKSVATFDATSPPDIADSYASALAEVLNAGVERVHLFQHALSELQIIGYTVNGSLLFPPERLSEEACKFFGVSGQAPSAQPADLQGLRQRLLSPCKIERDSYGWMSHPELPICDESVRYDVFLALFGIQVEFVTLEQQDEAAADRYFEEKNPGVLGWTPTPPDGDGWVLLSIYDHEDGPAAMFGRAMPEVVHG